MAYIVAGTMSRLNLENTLRNAMVAATEAANGVPRDEGMPDRKFVYLRIPRIRIDTIQELVESIGWELSKRRVPKTIHNVKAFILYKEFGICDRQTKAMEAAVLTLRSAGYDAFIGTRYDWLT